MNSASQGIASTAAPVVEAMCVTVSPDEAGSRPESASGETTTAPPDVAKVLAPGEVVIGTYLGVSGAGEPLVEHPLSPGGVPLVARCAVRLTYADRERNVVLAFEGGDLSKPIVLGLLWGQEPISSPAQEPVEDKPSLQPLAATVDGQHVVLSAARELVLRCGRASVTLTRAGKILIRGTYLVSRSSGVNRIKGGSVQIN